MFDGVGWAAGEIVVFLVIATLIGFAIGWVLGRWVQKSTIAEKLESMTQAERERARKFETQLHDGNRELDDAQLLLKGREEKLGELESELEAARGIATDLETRVAGIDDKDAEIASLSTDLEAKADLEAKLGSLDEKDAEIARLSGELATCGTDQARLTDAVAKLEGAISGRDARIAALEADIDAAQAELAARAEVVVEPEPVVEPESVVEPEPVAEVAEPTVEPSKEEGLARIEEIAARTAGDGPAVDDDLKKVHGIGPKLEKTLKDLGITSFRQIANFQREDIVYVTAALDAFKGRIERDDWMSSAAEEHQNKYSEPA